MWMRMRSKTNTGRNHRGAYDSASDRAEQEARRIMDKAMRRREDEKGPEGHSESQPPEWENGQPQEKEDRIQGISKKPKKENER